MGSDINVQNKKGVIYIFLTGTYTKNKFLECVNLVRESCEKHQTDKAIIDGRTITNPDIPDIDRFLIGEQMAIKLIGYKVSILWPEAFIKNFGTQVAVNRGAQARTFANEEEALNWLNQ